MMKSVKNMFLLDVEDKFLRQECSNKTSGENNVCLQRLDMVVGNGDFGGEERLRENTQK